MRKRKDMTLLHVIGVIVLLHSAKGSNSTWYQGCFQVAVSNQLKHSTIVQNPVSLAECGHSCWTQRFHYVLVQVVDEDVLCKCVNSSNGFQSSNCCLESKEDQLLKGAGKDCYGLYTSLGPYLTSVTVETDGVFAEVNKSVAIDINIERAAALDVTEDNNRLGHELMIHWSATGNRTIHNATVDMSGYVEYCHRPKYTFTEPGLYTLDVTVTNGLTTLSAKHDLEVIYPSPKNLQVDISNDNDLDLPACIPNDIKVTKEGYQLFAVFVSTRLDLQASVSKGTDLSFSFWFEDTDDESIVQACGDCTSVVKTHTFEEVGEWTVTVMVKNSFGWTRRTVTMVVIDRQLANLQIRVDPGSSLPAKAGDPVRYIISLVTTSRSNLSLQVWYGDGHSNTVSIKDTNFPALVLTGDGREMDIVADYGDGCELIVEFEYIYNHEGLFKPEVAIFEDSSEIETDLRSKMDFDLMRQLSQLGALPGFTLLEKKPIMKVEIVDEVMIVKELTMIRIEVNNAVNRVVRCDEDIDLTVKSDSRHNISVHWLISKIKDSLPAVDVTQLNYFANSLYDANSYYGSIEEPDVDDIEIESTLDVDYDADSAEIVKDYTSTSLYLQHSLSQVGVYMIKVNITNAVSSATARTNVVVQCPINHIYANCSPDYVLTGSEIECAAMVMEGSDVLFVWIIDGDKVKQYIQQENHTSYITHRFLEPGFYDVSVQALNNVSSDYYQINKTINVQDPIRHFEVYRTPNTLLGNVTVFGALYTASEYAENYYCFFDFDFGNGRESFTEVCKSGRCYVEIDYRFPDIGKHTVTVYAYNLVSEISKEVDIWVYPSLAELWVEEVGTSVAGSPARFLIKDQGETMATDNVYFTWKIGDEAYFTNSPLFEITFPQPGIHTVVVNATNPVVNKTMEVFVVVQPRSEVKVQLLHDLYTTPGSEVKFTLKGPLIGWSKLKVQYSDGFSEIHEGVTYTWQHKFEHVGAYEIFVSLLGTLDKSVDVTSYVMVEEPVSGLAIYGSNTVIYKEDYDTFTWFAKLSGGSNVIYKWTLEMISYDRSLKRTFVITHPRFETNLPNITGKYTLRVEAVNDVSGPIVAVMPILIEYPIDDILVEIFGNLVGKETLIQTNITAYRPFYIDASFGDGNTISLSSEDILTDIISVQRNFHTVNLTHVYEYGGEFEITLIVSNKLTNVTYTDIFVPISNITLVPKSPRLFRTTGHAKVIAIVTGGKNLNPGTWNFSDDYGDTHVRMDGNQTSLASLAIHPYSMSGEYPVTFSVTGQHYPDPGISVSLHFNFTVVDPIDTLKMKTDKIYDRNAAALEGNATHEVLFGYESSGSHVTYVFDFGDGTVSNVAGIQLPPQSLETTMYGEGRHVFTEVGIYNVMVTARNQLGSMSLSRPHVFYVQEPPTGLQLCDENKYNKTTFTGRVGQNISLCATVMSGTNVTFDWKLGDQSDIVKAGPRVTHMYQTANVHKGFVIAKNKVHSIEHPIYVDINRDIQGVTMTASQKIVAMDQPVWFEAVVHPNHTNIVTRYQWTFKPLARRSRSGRQWRLNSRRNKAIYYSFSDVGMWLATVSAQNSISRATSEPVEIEVQEKVDNLEIILETDRTSWLVGELITFKYYMYSSTTKMQLTWNFGDGTKTETTTETKVQHVFTSEGRYTISLTAANDVSSQTVWRYLFVLLKSYCDQPQVTILLQNRTKLPYSKPLTIEADVKTDCNLSSVVSYEWSLETQKPWQIKPNSLNRRVLVLPPGTLELGLHKINFQVTMTGTIVHTESSVFVEVVHSQLVSRIRGGVFRLLKRSDLVVLDGSPSYDPDTGDNSTLRYFWTCRYTKASGVYGETCFDSSCSVAMDTEMRLMFEGECLIEASNYTFELTVFSEGRENDTSFQVLQIIEENRDTLDVSIIQPFNNAKAVNADRKLAFFVECSNCEGTDIQYEWTLKYLQDKNRWNVARAHDALCVEPDGDSYRLIQENEEEEKKNSEEKEQVDTLPQKTDNTGAYGIDNSNQSISLADPLLKIKEGSSDSGRWGSVETTTGFVYLDQANPGQTLTIPNLYGISENTQDVSGRVHTHKDITNTLSQGFKEALPGESGSSPGRQHGRVVEGGSGLGRQLNIPEKETDKDLNSLDAILGAARDKERKYTILEQRPWPYYLEESDTKTGLTSQSLVIKPGILKQGMTYIIQSRVFDEGRQIEGYAMSSFTVNVSPVYGKCTIDPQSGTAMETEFSLFCWEWKDDKHEPLMYEVSYSMQKSHADKHLVYRGMDHEFTVRLPAGRVEEDYNVYVCIDILDSLLAKTSVCSIAIRVTPWPGTEEHARGFYHHSLSKTIYDEVTSPTSVLQQSVDHGNDAVSKVYISYLADSLNAISDHQNCTNTTRHNQTVFNDTENEKAISVYEDKPEEEEEAKELRVKARTELLRILNQLPVRDEAEILQTAQALSYATAKDDELSLVSVDLSVKILKSIAYSAQEVYNHDLTPTGSLIPLAVRSTASIVKATVEIAQDADEALEVVYKRLVSESVEAVESLVLNELKFYVISEEPIVSTTDYFSVLAARHSARKNLTLQIHDARFQLPENLAQVLSNRAAVEKLDRSTNEQCFQSHMTSFKTNPYSFKESEKVNSLVSGLTLYDCHGVEIAVDNLPKERQVQVDLPNIPPQAQAQTLKLERWAMNLHQFNMSLANLNLSVHLVVELTPVNKGRLFPVTVLIRVQVSNSLDSDEIPHYASSHLDPDCLQSWNQKLSPDSYHYKYDFEPGHDIIDLFFPPGTFNVTGKYYVGLVDSTYNAGRPRQGEITERDYTLKLWWGECFYWNMDKESWRADGCHISHHSTYKVTKCDCNHLTVFGGRFQLIPNRLYLLDVDMFFSLHANPITVTMVSIAISVYLLMLIWCRHADQYDARKGGIVYLLDNTAADQQKYEITLETGIRKGAGTTAKISMILHGEEGMSETRELISEDDRPMFERNSTDKFILTLPESIGRIWKVQIWHNNFGESPSWYLSRVVVRDLNTGSQYLFQCDKWLAVEEQDGKVEREFMVQESPLSLTKVFITKMVQNIADLHIWLSLITCPPYSGFVRIERLTLCLTTVMLHMGLMAVWFQHIVTEYRGEFSLLDVSWMNVVVGAVCCALIVPVSLALEILFRRSKPKHASSCHYKDEGSQWDVDYPSGKPNEQESEDNSEHVPPVMTYSLLDQSILNWPNIQTWAQKQWMKRQQSVRSHPDNHKGSSEHSDQSMTHPLVPKSFPTMESVLNGQGFSEMDQASSGFEDCSSLIRPKASVDSTHTTAAPSVAESMRTHKPPSPPDSLQLSKPGSISDSVKSTKAPSISSSASNKSSVLGEKKVSILSHVYLPYWCRYIAWSLCTIICIGCAAVTIGFGLRFGMRKSTLWLQSLYFSTLFCVFLAYPLQVLLAVIYSTLCYLRDPTSALDTYSYDLFNREKAKEDLHKWKKQMELLEEGEALERGVAARQRSRYLRFARPPQEKQLIEARKRVMKEKKALTILRESIAFVATILLLLIIAYGKDTRPCYHLNTAVKNQFVNSGSPTFTSIKAREEWYSWFQASLLPALELLPRLEDKSQETQGTSSSYVIGNVQLRQQRLTVQNCKTNLPYLTMKCLGDQVTNDNWNLSDLVGATYTSGHHGNFMIGKSGIYDASGYVLSLNQSSAEASMQIDDLKASSWLDRQTKAVFVEFTLYNAPTNLFTAVDLLLEMSPTGAGFPVVKVTSSHLFRYVTASDNLVLICEMLFFIVMMYTCKTQLSRCLDLKKTYFTMPWNVLNFVICLLSVFYCSCYIYRFIIVSSIVESLRSTYYEKYVDVSFITFWDEMLRSTVSVLLFLAFIRCLRLLRYNKQFTVFGDVYRRARREVITLFAMFVCVTAAYSSLGYILFGCVYSAFHDLLGSVTAVVALLVGKSSHPEQRSQEDRTSTGLFLFTFCIFGIGFLTVYMVAVLTHYFKARRKRRLLAMGGKEAVLFYWRQFQLWTGIKKQIEAEEEIIILPPEFTMAEIEYQVDELLFRMNALTGSHGLPEKPPCYMTDSDCTYGGGDDGISSGGSEAGQLYGEDRLEQRVQKIEDNLCSQEPFLAQLLKLDSVATDDWSHEKEKQLRSHLELEIFRQLQMQRQDLKSPSAEEPATKDDKAEESTPATCQPEHNQIHGSTSSDDSGQKQEEKSVKLLQTNLATQILQDLITKSPQDRKDSQNDNSSSNPDSPLDKLTFTRMKKNTDGILKPKTKPNSSSTSSSEKISPDLSLNHAYLPETESIKKPTKPTFLHSRESSLSEASKGSPSLKVHVDKGPRSEAHLGGIERMLESSSGSEQDGIRVGRKAPGKRSLRKTKSRGKGKGADSLEPALILDELEGEEGEGVKVEINVEEEDQGGSKAKEGNEYTIQADVHQEGNR